ncbi:MAG: hypothetical protein ACRDZ7_17105 [Acidimicrobiia bacterium]
MPKVPCAIVGSGNITKLGRSPVLEPGRRKAVGGQEDMIIDVAVELSRQPGARGGPEDAAAAAARS